MDKTQEMTMTTTMDDQTMLSELMAAAAGVQADPHGPGLEIPWATLDVWVRTLTASIAEREATQQKTT